MVELHSLLDGGSIRTERGKNSRVGTTDESCCGTTAAVLARAVWAGPGADGARPRRQTRDRSNSCMVDDRHAVHVFEQNKETLLWPIAS